LWQNLHKKNKNRQKGAHSSPFDTSETKNSRNAKIGVNIARGVRMMLELLFFKLCTALIFNCGKILSPKLANSKNANFFSTRMVAPHICMNSIYSAFYPPWDGKMSISLLAE